MDSRKDSNIPNWKNSKVSAAEASLELKFKKEISKEVEDKKSLYLELLEIIDDIDRIIGDNGEVQPDQKYLSVIRKKILKSLEKYGVSKMCFDDNKAKFGWCEVISTQKVDGAEEETIIKEVKKGYLWNDKILRLASVVIVKNGEE